MHALVTGANGFLGRCLVEQLLGRGDCVRVLVRREDDHLRRIGAELAIGDLRLDGIAAAVTRGVDVVFHTAAIAGIWGRWRDFYHVNTQATRDLVAASQTNGVGSLVYTSSPSVTFDGRDQCAVSESAPYPRRWLCAYSHTKALAEQAVLAAHGTGGLATCALRPHLIWGPRDRHLIPRLLERARSGRLIRIGDGSNLVDNVFVDDAARAHLQAADALVGQGACGGKAYYISQGEPVRLWTWIDELLVAAGLPPVRRAISFEMAWRVGALMELAYWAGRRTSEPRMTRFLAAQLARSHYFDITAARRDFGYQPQISTAEGIRRLASDGSFDRRT